MRKEIWILISLLGIIFGVIWLFSRWNSTHLMKKLKRIRKEQEVICKYMTDIATKHDIGWNDKICKNVVIGKTPDDWADLRKCTSEKQVDFLKCMGEKLCKQKNPEGCILKYETFLHSKDSKKINEGISNLNVMCKKEKSNACTVLALWYEKHPDKKTHFKSKIVEYRKKACLSGNISMCKKPEYVLSLEECSSENINSCLKSFNKSSSSLVFWLACSYGNGVACRKYYETLLGVKISNKKLKNLFKALLPNLCLRGDLTSCAIISKMTKSKGLMVISCKNGDENSCKNILQNKKQYKISSLTEKFLKNNLCLKGNVKYCN